MTPRPRLDALLALSLAGVAVAAYLSWVALDPDAAVECSGVGDCAAVQSSEYADVAGIPVALLGLAMYATLAALCALRRIGPWSADPAGEPRALGVWCFALALAGTGFSAYLTYLELFVIEAICVWCVGSAALITAIAVLAAVDLGPHRRSAA
ncbi:MAG: vitamin K epoxide reductase family protein [Chloroflexi bacterium]|nr:vitamin K epoxide reductase family protein [Chloroflexota bacterium]